MNHYITPDNKLWGFDETQAELIPKDAVLIPSEFSVGQIPYITLVNSKPTFDKIKYDADKLAQETLEKFIAEAKNSALAKLAKLGLSEDEVKALIG